MSRYKEYALELFGGPQDGAVYRTPHSLPPVWYIPDPGEVTIPRRMGEYALRIPITLSSTGKHVYDWKGWQ